MRAREFAYWLQGYFEIEGAAESLTSAQARKILGKLEKVDMTGGDAAEQKAAAFASFAKGGLTGISYVSEAEQASALRNFTQTLRSSLNDLFIHAIDPTLPGDQDFHRNNHRPGGDRYEAMC
jgi:hypothetical protein